MQRRSFITSTFVLLAELALVIGLTLFDPAAILLGFVLSAQAMFMLPRRSSVLWLAFLVLTTGVLSVYHAGWVRGSLVTLAYAAGYASFGFAYYARERANTALHASESLLADLQEAHRQLQAYADRAEELAVVEERNRLAREVHDTLGHHLTVATVQLEGAQRLIPSDPERAAVMIGTVRDQIREALGELRRTVAALQAPPEIDLSLPQALTRLTANFEAATGLSVHLALPEDMPDLPDVYRGVIYRVAQEALSNVEHHARARDVWIDWVQQDAAVVLTVSDNGIGIPADHSKQAGFGLFGMRERAARLDGKLTVQPRSGGGTQLSMRLPLPAEETDG
jgi:signal transduction histidine kinase